MSMDDVDWVNIIQNVVYAVVILLVTWIVAKIVKWAISKLVEKITFLQKAGGDGQPIGDSIGTIGSLIVWLFGLVAVLQLFELDAALDPVQDLLGNVMAYLPNVIGAGVVFFIGFVIARIAKQLVESGVGMINFGGITSRIKKADPVPAGREAQPSAEGSAGAGGSAGTAGQSGQGSGMDAQRIGSMVGNLVFVVIVVVVGIAALQVLNISAISDPAVQMLDIILAAIPAIIAALLILGIGYLIAKFIGPILESTLEGLGLDRALASLGLSSEERSASTIVTRIAQIAIVVFFAVAATRALGFAEITDMLNAVLGLGGHVVFGGVIIAAGFLVAKVITGAIGESTTATIVRYATLVLFTAMGLKYMGIADEIVGIAFGAVVIGGALAAALAFGIGGREAAGRYLEERRQNLSGGTKGQDSGKDSGAHSI